MKIVWIVLAVLVSLFVILWVGTKIQFAPFKPFPQSSGTIKTVPLPAGLPAPVDRFYRTVYGDQVPVIESAVITTHAVMRPFPIPVFFPARFRFSHIAGQSYRHYIEMGLFGVPLFKVNERYVDGKSLFAIPGVGSVDNEPKTNQGANLGMWAESTWFPAIYLTDPRVKWEPVDDVTAILVVPFEDTFERYVVRFDPKTALITHLESMRYHAADSAEKTLWINEAREWSEMDGTPFQKSGAAIWMDDGKPWAIFTVDDIVYNVDLKEYILQEGE
jgi:hypothetical protein